MGAETLTESLGPLVTPTRVTFQLADPDELFEEVRLYQEIERPRSGPPLARSKGLWSLEWPRPMADRIEYMFEVKTDGEDPTLIPDPHNPLSADGPFGAKSVIEFPDYEPPAWVAIDPEAHGSLKEIPLPSRVLRGRFAAHLWSAPGLADDDPAPLLIAHDGPEYARYSLLAHFFDVMLEAGELPRFRAVLLPPVDRNETYSASARYARAFVHEVLPTLASSVPTPHGRASRVGMGASLGALAMLHVHRMSPESFGGLFLQSGSYFRQRFDPQESTFGRFRRITRFTGKVLNSPGWEHPIAVAMTCGTAEENLRNNRAMFDALSGQGYEATFDSNHDAHNWTSWRDSLHPALTRLLTKVWA